MPATTLETKRLRLRPPRMEDLAAHHAALGSDGAVTWLREPRSVADSEAVLRRRVEHFEQHGFGMWVVELADTGEFLGEAGLQHFEGTEEVEVGYYLARATWGAGVATEAGRTAIAHGFDTLGLGHIVAVVRPENAGSKRVLTKLGLRFDHLGDHYDVAGVEVWRIDR